MAELNGTNGTNGVSGTEEAAAAGTVTAERTSEAARVEEMVARSLAQTRSWINRRRLSPEVLAPPPRLSTREWLVRAAFALFALVAMSVVVFSALGLLNATEAISAMLPVATLSAVIVGVYLGSGQGS
jgi:hypothetical protein